MIGRGVVFVALARLIMLRRVEPFFGRTMES
jgi:hypothetical protein